MRLKLRIAHLLSRNPSDVSPGRPARHLERAGNHHPRGAGRALEIDLGRLLGWPIARGESDREPGGVAALSLIRWLRKSSGDLRLIEAPKPRLKAIRRGYRPRSSR